MTEPVIHPQDRLIPAHEIVQMINMSEASIQNGMRDGKIPCVQVGQKRMMTQLQYRFWISSLEAASGWYQEDTPKPKAKAKPKAKVPVEVEAALEAVQDFADAVTEAQEEILAESVPPPAQDETTADSPF